MAPFCVPFMTKDFEALFHIRLSIWTSLMECLCKAGFWSISPLVIRVFRSGLLESFVYSRYGPLGYVYFKHFLSLRITFQLVMVSFDEEKFLILML